MSLDLIEISFAYQCIWAFCTLPTIHLIAFFVACWGWYFGGLALRYLRGNATQWYSRFWSLLFSTFCIHFLTIYKRWSISHYIRHVQWDWLPPSLLGRRIFFFFENFSIKTRVLPRNLLWVSFVWLLDSLNNWWFNNYLSSSSTS